MVEETPSIIGTDVHETIDGTNVAETIIALAGDDIINANDGDDIIYGDYVEQNLLTGTEGATSFAQFGATGAWTVQEEANGYTSMSQSVITEAGADYTVNFEIAANIP